jgi:hypothetical protein
MRATLTLAGPPAASGRIVLAFSTAPGGGAAVARGTLGGRPVHVSLPVPWAPQD